MLKHKRLVSIIATLAFCLSFLAPALIAPAPAVAADMYQVVKTASVQPSTNFQNTGAVIKVTVPDIQIASGSRLTVSLPSDWDVQGNSVIINADTPSTGRLAIVGSSLAATDDGEMVSAAALGGAGTQIPVSPNKSFDLRLVDTADVGANVYFYIYFNGIDLNNMTGDLNVTFVGPQGSIFQTGQVSIGKSSRSGATSTTIKKKNALTTPGGALDIITVSELQAATLDLNGSITLKILTKGVTWDTAGAASYGWDFAGSVNTAAGANLDPITASMIEDNGKELVYPIHADAVAANGEPGRLSFAGLAVEIDDEEAKVGDTIQVKVSGADMTSATIDVATYNDYGITLKEGTSVDLIAGKGDQDVGTFTIEESAFGSLVQNRTIKVTLPNGVKWNSVNGEMETINDSDLFVDVPAAVSGSEEQILLFNVDTPSSDNAGTVEFKDFTVDVAPDFAGPIEVAVSGSAGVEGKVKIGEVKPAVSISVDTVKNINLGQAKQALGEITLTEGIAEGLEDGNLVLKLDNSYRWSEEPTVEVTEGNIDIDADVDVDDETLTISIESTSTIPSKIVISDAYVDAFRNAPEGPIYLTVGNLADDNCTAILDVADITDGNVENDWRELNGGKAQVATCVTPAEIAGSSVSFYIGSTIMNVNGANKIMDASPYIKAGRTYVPIRALGEALGANVQWDAATKTVTITKADKTVVLVIGSTVAKVNGADVQMDVAPEITGVGRTMLPARWVAEGLGYTVGWNAALQQVVIQ